MKQLRGNSRKHASSIDGKANPTDIAKHFRNLYKNIFNEHNDQDEVRTILHEINAHMNQSDVSVVDKIDSDLVKRVIQK